MFLSPLSSAVNLPVSKRFVNAATSVEYSNITCFEDHPVRFMPRSYRKLRSNGAGVIGQPAFSSFRCQACQVNVVLDYQGYYSCDESCDFDLCSACMKCSIDGNLLFESFEPPSQDTIR